MLFRERFSWSLVSSELRLFPQRHTQLGPWCCAIFVTFRLLHSCTNCFVPWWWRHEASPDWPVCVHGVLVVQAFTSQSDHSEELLLQQLLHWRWAQLSTCWYLPKLWFWLWFLQLQALNCASSHVTGLRIWTSRGFYWQNDICKDNSDDIHLPWLYLKAVCDLIRSYVTTCRHQAQQ